MIQRIQSIYLAVSVICLSLAIFIPLANYEIDGAVVGVFDLLAFSPNDEVLSLPVLVLVFTAMLVSVLCIFQFANRALQMKLARAAMFFSILAFLVFAGLHYKMILSLNLIGELGISYSFTVVAPIAAAVLQWLAYKGIKKDDDKVRSVDRLR